MVILERGDVLDNAQGNDDFDIAVEDAISDRPSKKGKISRQGRDQKFGFGGSKKHSKSNTRQSTDDFEPGRRKGTFTAGKGGKGGKGAKKGGPNRPGKSRRAAARSK